MTTPLSTHEEVPSNPTTTALPPVSVITLAFGDLCEDGHRTDPQPRPYTRVRVRISDTIAPSGQRQPVYVVEASPTRQGIWRRYDRGSESELIDFNVHGAEDWVMEIVAVEVQQTDAGKQIKTRKSRLTIPPSIDVGDG